MRPAVFSFTLAVAGCSPASSSSNGNVGSGATQPPGPCAMDARAQTFMPGMASDGHQGNVRVVLHAIDPAPPIKGDNTWTFELDDANGQPLTGATIQVKPWMPDHGHGTSIVPSVTELGGGSYEIDHLDFAMPGLWQTTITVSGPAVTDYAVFSFCIAG